MVQQAYNKEDAHINGGLDQGATHEPTGAEPPLALALRALVMLLHGSTRAACRCAEACAASGRRLPPDARRLHRNRAAFPSRSGVPSSPWTGGSVRLAPSLGPRRPGGSPARRRREDSATRAPVRRYHPPPDGETCRWRGAGRPPTSHSPTLSLLPPQPHINFSRSGVQWRSPQRAGGGGFFAESRRFDCCAGFFTRSWRLLG